MRFINKSLLLYYFLYKSGLSPSYIFGVVSPSFPLQKLLVSVLLLRQTQGASETRVVEPETEFLSVSILIYLES